MLLLLCKGGVQKRFVLAEHYLGVGHTKFHAVASSACAHIKHTLFCFNASGQLTNPPASV